MNTNEIKASNRSFVLVRVHSWFNQRFLSRNDAVEFSIQ